MKKTRKEFPDAFHVKILQRFLSEKSLKELYEQYRNAYLTTRSVSEPSEQDRRIVSVLRQTKNYKVAAEKLGISEYRIVAAAGRVGIYSA